ARVRWWLQRWRWRRDDGRRRRQWRHGRHGRRRSRRWRAQGAAQRRLGGPRTSGIARDAFTGRLQVIDMEMPKIDKEFLLKHRFWITAGAVVPLAFMALGCLVWGVDDDIKVEAAKVQ